MMNVSEVIRTMHRKSGLAYERISMLAYQEQDMRGAGVTMAAWEYRVKWYGEEELLPAFVRPRSVRVPSSGGSSTGVAV